MPRLESCIRMPKIYFTQTSPLVKQNSWQNYSFFVTHKSLHPTLLHKYQIQSKKKPHIVSIKNNPWNAKSSSIFQLWLDICDIFERHSPPHKGKQSQACVVHSHWVWNEDSIPRAMIKAEDPLARHLISALTTGVLSKWVKVVEDYRSQDLRYFPPVASTNILLRIFSSFSRKWPPWLKILHPGDRTDLGLVNACQK